MVTKKNNSGDLIIARKELALQKKENAKQAAELSIADREHVSQNNEKEKRAAELVIAKKKLVFQNQEKEKRADELAIANKELIFQNKEKEKRADELAIANKELVFQNKEKEKRAAELAIANKKLAFENKEKEKRAGELAIANKELVFQNKEKEKRAAELAIANKELAFQNKEKEKRADELAVANEELIFQNKEKEKRAAELGIANKELVFQNKEKERRADESAIVNKELLHSELRLKQAQGVAHFGNWELNFATGIALWSEEMLKIYGLSPEERAQSYNSWLAFIHPEDLAYVVEVTTEERNTSGSSAFHHRIVRQDGTIRYLYARANTEFNADGEPIGLYGAVHDITEMKEAETVLRESQRKLTELGDLNQKLIDVSPMGIASFDGLSGQCLSVNEAFAKIIGASGEQILEQNFRNLQSWITSDLLKDAEDTLANGKVHYNEVNITSSFGKVIWIDYSFVTFSNKSQTLLLMQINDVTQRKLAEQALHESESNVQAIFDNSSEGFVLSDTKGIIKAFNRKAKGRIKLNTDQDIKVGTSIFDYIQTSRKDNYKDSISKVLAGELLHYDYPYTRKNGEIKWFHFTVNPVSEHGTVTGISISSSDITQRKEAEQQLQESELFSKGILSSLHSQIAVINNQGTIIAVNKAWDDFARENGATTLERVSTGSNYFEVCKRSWEGGEINAKKTLEGIQSVFRKEIPNFELEYPCDSPDEKRWFNLHVSNFGDDDSKVVISHLNITERKIAEEKTIQSEKYSRDLFEQSIVGLALSRMDGTLADVNEAYAKIIGRTIEETKQLTYWEITPEKYMEQENEVLKELSNTGKFTNYEKEYIHKKGYLVPVRLSGNIIEKEGEKFIWSSIEDITETKRLKKAVENERDQFFNMFLKAPSAIGMLRGANHVFEMVNPLYLQLIGKKDVIGKTVAEVLPEVIEQGFIDLLDGVYNSGKSYRGTEVLVKLDKEGNGELADAYLNFIYEAYRNDEGNIEGVFFFLNEITEQIQSRKKIEESEKFFKGVIESSADMITILDPAGKTLYASPSVQKKFGYTYEECLNLNLAEVVHPDDALIMQELFMKVMTLPSVPVECPIIRNRKKDGTYIFVEGTITNFLDTEGIHAIVANFRDVTERKKAVELIVRSEANVNAIIENTDAFIYSIDTDYNYITFNSGLKKSLKEAYGLDVRQGDNVLRFMKQFDSAQADEWEAIYSKAFKGEIVKFEKEFKVNEFYSYTSFSIHPIWENRIVIGLSCFVSDITKQKQTSDALMQSEFQYRRIVETSQEGIWLIDENNLTTFVNKKMCDILEYSEEEMMGKENTYFMDDAGTKEAAITMERRKKGVAETIELRYITKSGKHIWTNMSANPILDDKGNYKGALGMITNITEKKKLEDLLDKTNRLAAIGSWEIDVIKGTVFWSDVTKEIREVDKDFVPRLDIGISYFKEGSHKEIISQKVNECIENGTPWDEELEIITFKGNPKWVRTIGEGEFINGNCIRVYGSFQDIDKRKKAELEVLKVYEEKNIILESIGDGFYTLDNNWIITYWNNQAEKMIGRTKEEMVGKNFWEEFPDVIDTPPYAAYLKATKENAIQHFEMYYESFKTWYQVSIYPSVNGLSVYFQDVTERQLAEQQIKTDKNLLRTLIDHLPDTIYYKDKSAKKLISNKFDYTVLGADTEQEVLGKTDLEISSHGNALMTYAQDMEILNTGNPLINFEEYFTTADDKPLWLLTSKLPLRDENNVIIGLLGIGRDITQRKIAEDKLIELNKALEKNIKKLEISNIELEQFAYVASHDLQEPLRMITSFLTLLEKKYSNQIDDKGKQYIGFAVDGGKRMRQIILDLLEFSRVGRTEDTLEKVDLNELVNEILSLQSQQIEDVKAKIQVDTLPILNSYKAPLRQVFQNLINNGLKYHKDGVPLHISISVKDDEIFWQFAITDNGIGIENAYLNKIFIIFQRLHNKEKYTGTGIGLAITRKIIESLGGKIWVESEAGRGSTFYFTIKK
jgi:PAS domain S-box-containing protein